MTRVTDVLVSARRRRSADRQVTTAFRCDARLWTFHIPCSRGISRLAEKQALVFFPRALSEQVILFQTRLNRGQMSIWLPVDIIPMLKSGGFTEHRLLSPIQDGLPWKAEHGVPKLPTTAHQGMMDLSIGIQ